DENPAEPEAPAKGLALFGIPVTSERVVVLIDASSILVRPADIELSKEKTWREWRSIAEKDRDYVTQFDLLRSAVRDLVRALPASSRFNLLALNSSSTITPFWPKGTATANESVKRRADAFLDEVLVGGWAPQIAGIWEAYRIAGCGPWVTKTPDAPEVEEIFLLGNGVPRGGAFLYAPAIIDEVERRHRFRRITIHTVRVGDRDEPAEELMKGIAEVTGGRYVWKKKPD
ncbi:MAG: vWA domain-containing protein, partial [Planctomycetota bacterium]